MANMFKLNGDGSVSLVFKASVNEYIRSLYRADDATKEAFSSAAKSAEKAAKDTSRAMQTMKQAVDGSTPYYDQTFFSFAVNNTAYSALKSLASQAVESFATYGASACDAAERTGFTVETITALGYAAKKSGVETSALEGAIRGFQNQILAASNGSAEASKKFAELGVDVNTLINAKPEDAFVNSRHKKRPFRRTAKQPE